MTAAPRPVPLAKSAIDRFLLFHAELVGVKHLADSMIAAEASDEEMAAPTYNGITPVDLFLRLRVAICPDGAPPPSTDGRPDIGYVMAAMADEALLHQVDWPGREQWVGTLLEQSLYGSRVAGEELFDLGQGIADGTITGRTDLAAAILLALSLGFRGRYRDIPDNGAIDALRRQLYEHVYKQPPPRDLDWRESLSATQAPVLDGNKPQRLPRLTPWLTAIVLALAFGLAASSWIWIQSTAPLMDAAEKVRLLGLSIVGGQKP